MKSRFLIIVFSLLLLALIYVLFLFSSNELTSDVESVDISTVQPQVDTILISVIDEGEILELISETSIQQQVLDEINAVEWAGTQWEEYTESIRLAEDLFLEGNYDESYHYYALAISQGEALLANNTERFNELLELGLLQLANGQASDALDTFSIASYIDDDHVELVSAITRANNYDRIIRLYEEALTFDMEGLIDQSLVIVDELILLDTSFSDAYILRNKLISKINTRDFNLFMTQGYRSLNLRDSLIAKRYFAEALTLEPDSEIARNAYAQAEQLAISQEIERNFQSGERYSTEENWDLAIFSFERALELNPNLDYLINGHNVAMERKLFDEKIKFYLDNPMTLLEDGVLTEVEQTLLLVNDFNFSDNSIMPNLIGTLQEIYSVMVEPVSVQMLSDGYTEVEIIREGHYGKFNNMNVMLTPGHYIARGIRNGYRDIRISFSVIPGEDLLLEVICAERI
jgi:tetratricopeptide (TPR) repeat protein